MKTEAEIKERLAEIEKNEEMLRDPEFLPVSDLPLSSQQQITRMRNWHVAKMRSAALALKWVLQDSSKENK